MGPWDKKPKTKYTTNTINHQEPLSVATSPLVGSNNPLSDHTTVPWVALAAKGCVYVGGGGDFFATVQDALWPVNYTKLEKRKWIIHYMYSQQDQLVYHLQSSTSLKLNWISLCPETNYRHSTTGYPCTASIKKLQLHRVKLSSHASLNLLQITAVHTHTVINSLSTGQVTPIQSSTVWLQVRLESLRQKKELMTMLKKLFT